MIDRRELILARLLTVCETLRGLADDEFITVARNLTEVSGRGMRPALVIQEGDEEVEAPSGNHSGRTNLIMRMTPAVLIAVQGAPETVGATLNTLSRRVLYAVLNDAGLENLCGTNGRVNYTAGSVRLDEGEKTEGQMLLRLSFTYLFRPQELAPDA